MFIRGICGVVGRVTACVCGNAGSIPTGGALKVWQWTLGSKTAGLVNKSAGQPPFISIIMNIMYFHIVVLDDTLA